MTTKEFFEKVLEETKGIEITELLSDFQDIFGNNMGLVSQGSGQKFLPYVQSKLFKIPQKGDLVYVLNDKIIGQYQSKKVANYIPNVKWSDIIGLDDQIAEIQEILEDVDDTAGILLYGETGLGKTYIAKAIANHLLKSAPQAAKENPDIFNYVKGGSIQSKFVGETEQEISRMFKRAREIYREYKVRPILFIDEAEVVVPSRTGFHTSSQYVRANVATFLAEMDGFDENNPLVILSTNHPDQIDSAVLRPGRVDLKIGLRRPTKTEFEKQLVFYKLDKKVAKRCTELIPEEFQLSGALAKTLSKFITRKAKKSKINDELIQKSIILCSSTY